MMRSFPAGCYQLIVEEATIVKGVVMSGTLCVVIPFDLVFPNARPTPYAQRSIFEGTAACAVRG